MVHVDDIYNVLRRHLDKQALGFPATETGIEIRILQHLFNPEQAGLALYVENNPQTATDIFTRIETPGSSFEKVIHMLEEMETNGAIRSIEKNGITCYYTAPARVMMTFHRPEATPQFWADWEEYTNNDEIRLASANVKVPTMRTIPLEHSISAEHHIATYDRLREIINNADGPIAVRSCRCRESAADKGQPCLTTERLDTCLHFGGWARHFIDAGTSREITRAEALRIARLNEAEGLLFQPSNEKNVDFVCSCCPCCCESLKKLKKLPKPAESWASNYYATVNTNRCTNCGVCEQKCPMNAAKLDDWKGYSTINLDRCIGCGVCVAACPSQALGLVRKETETIPPDDVPALYKKLADGNA